MLLLLKLKLLLLLKQLLLLQSLGLHELLHILLVWGRSVGLLLFGNLLCNLEALLHKAAVSLRRWLDGRLLHLRLG